MKEALPGGKLRLSPRTNLEKTRRSPGRGFGGKFCSRKDLVDLPRDRQFGPELANPALRRSKLHPPSMLNPARDVDWAQRFRTILVSYQSEQICGDRGDSDFPLESQNHVTRPLSTQLTTRRSRVRIPPPLCKNPVHKRWTVAWRGRASAACVGSGCCFRSIPIVSATLD
jgi:hypothetical protein